MTSQNFEVTSQNFEVNLNNKMTWGTCYITSGGFIIFPVVSESYSLKDLLKIVRNWVTMFKHKKENYSEIFQNNFPSMVQACDIEPLYLLLTLIMKVMMTTSEWKEVVQNILNHAVGFDFITSFARKQILKHLKIQDSSKILNV